MANVDVSFLVTDPDFADPIKVIRKTQSLNDYGEAVYTEKTYSLTGVVQPITGEALERLPEGARQNGAVTVWTQFEFQTQATGGHADTLIWKGKRWQALSNAPWTNFGNGYTETICIQEKINNG